MLKKLKNKYSLTDTSWLNSQMILPGKYVNNGLWFLENRKIRKVQKNTFLIDLICIPLVIVKLRSITAISELEAQT